MPEKVREIVTGWSMRGWGNEFTVRDLVSMDGATPSDRTVVKQPNRNFFGWQVIKHEEMREFLDALNEYGFRLRESLKLVQLEEGCEIKRVMTCTCGELVRNLTKFVTLGAVARILTRQLGKRGGVPDFVVTEKYSPSDCMTMSDMAHPVWGQKLCELLQKCEALYADPREFMADPLGGAAITGALKYLIDPTSDPILSNLEKRKDGEIILTDPGLMKVKNGERVSNIPRTRWLMGLTLRMLGELGFEAMNRALRDYGHDIEPRSLRVSNAVPKAVAWVGYGAIRLAKKFWKSEASDVAHNFSRSVSCLS